VKSQTRDAVEVTAISGNQSQVMAEGCGGDKQVVIPNLLTGCPKMSAPMTKNSHGIQIETNNGHAFQDVE